jgi:hypothetical protein
MNYAIPKTEKHLSIAILVRAGQLADGRMKNAMSRMSLFEDLLLVVCYVCLPRIQVYIRYLSYEQ